MNTLISKVRQPLGISGCQIRNPPLIKGSHRGGCPNSASKGAHNLISTCEASAQIPVCLSTKANSFIKKLNGRMPKWLQPNPAISRRKISCKTTTEIGNNLRIRTVLLFGKADKLAFTQVPNTTLPQQMLQNRIMGRSSNYVVEAYLPLTTIEYLTAHTDDPET